MGRFIFEPRVFEATVAAEVRTERSATFRGEQRHHEGKGLHELVDPKGYGGIRRSLPRLEKRGKSYVMLVGPPMLKETRFDTTGSMGGNVDLAFAALPDSYRLLSTAPGAPLGRYDLQIINGVFNDREDPYVLCRSQAEMDIKIAEQLRLMVPIRRGGDSDEDPQYGLFGAAYLTDARIVKYGLKGYDFTVTDACGRSRLSRPILEQVFGDEVYDRVAENGHSIDRDSLPTTKQIVSNLLKISHAFVILVGNEAEVIRFWVDLYGRERVVIVSDLEYLAAVEAAIIGLTEGTHDLQSVEQYLIDHSGLSKTKAAKIRKAVSGIPLGAQAALPNFDRLPKVGDRFKDKTEIWPIGFGSDGSPELDDDPVGTEPKGKGPSMWT